MTAMQNALAVREEKQQKLASYIQRLVPEIQRALPKHLDADRIARLALTVVRKDPALAECTPASFAGALLTASALGLEPGVNNEAYLVAYKGECTFIPGYQGLAKLFFQHPLARHMDAQVVHANDEFDYAYGLDPYLTHKPAKGDRGAIVYYYAVAALSTGAKSFVVLTPDEAKALRRGKVGSNGGIPDPMHWMERKTALRQLVKLLPKSTTLQRALEAEDRTGTEMYRELVQDKAPALAAAPDQEPEPEPAYVPHTGEILDAVPVEEPPAEPDWGPVAQPGQGGRR